MGNEQIKTFCSECGSNVAFDYRIAGPGRVIARSPCKVTDKGTVYRPCPGCGEEVAVSPFATHPHARATG